MDKTFEDFENKLVEYTDKWGSCIVPSIKELDLYVKVLISMTACRKHKVGITNIVLDVSDLIQEMKLLALLSTRILENELVQVRALSVYFNGVPENIMISDFETEVFKQWINLNKYLKANNGIVEDADNLFMSFNKGKEVTKEESLFGVYALYTTLLDKNIAEVLNVELSTGIEDIINTSAMYARDQHITQIDLASLYMAVFTDSIYRSYFLNWFSNNGLNMFSVQPQYWLSELHKFINISLVQNQYAAETEQETLREILKDGYNPFVIYQQPIDLECDSEEDVEATIESMSNNGPKNVLQAFGTNLVEEFNAGTLPQCFCRESEVLATIETLLRKTKCNPCLVGEPGVGKTAVAYEVVRYLCTSTNKVPSVLRNRPIWQISPAKLLAGTKYRGDFEARLDKCLQEVIATKAILFVDELQSFVSSNNSVDASISASDILKPYLATGKISLIGTTTCTEYCKYIESDSALSRRFCKIDIKEPTESDSKKIIKYAKGVYEKHHDMIIPDNVIDYAVDISVRYIPEKFLPDKALDLLDIAASSAHMHSSMTLKTTDIANAIEKLKGIPVKDLCTDEITKLRNLNESLHKRVVGQDKAVETLVKAVQRTKLGFSEVNKPNGVFMFVGPTGVGKTELAKALSEEVFNSKNAFIRLDMSEYSEQNAVTKLIGSPPGYVGYDTNTNDLVEKVSRNPYSVILFDEIEKAHPTVHNLLLQLFDDGRLTNTKGKTADFCNTIIIMTANVGAKDAENVKGSLGFGATDVNAVRQEVMEKALKTTFTPEFRNRITNTVYFNKLSEAEMIEIGLKTVKNVVDMLSTKGYKVQFSESEICEYIKTLDQKNGVRPLVNKIRETINTLLVDNRLSLTTQAVKVFTLKYIDNSLQLIPKTTGTRNLNAQRGKAKLVTV